MKQLRTSLIIVGHSLRVLARTPQLMVFALASLAATMLLYLFFLVPLLFDLAVSEVWQVLRDGQEGWQRVAPWRLAEVSQGNPWLGASLPGMAAYFLLAMFATTFINVALYSQILEALAGRRVSVVKGFRVAAAKLPAIAGWSLLAGTIGLLLRLVQERTGPLGKWVVGVAGISWTAASVFVIPVMLNEPRARNPVQYLRISTALIRRTWGEGIIGLYGLTLVLMLFMVVLMVPTTSLYTASEALRTQVMWSSTLIALVVSSVLYMAWQIFECGLYVYATEGVAPGTFDEDLFDRSWTIRPRAAGAPADADGNPEASARVWLAAPAVIATVLLGLAQFLPKPVRLLHADSPVASYVVHLASLDYALTYADLQAAGMFADQRCWSCDLSTDSGDIVVRTSEPHDGLQVTLFKQGPKGNLYLHFYGQDVEAGRVQVARWMQALRQRFPGREGAFMRLSGFDIAWDVVPQAVLYTLEIECPTCTTDDLWVREMGSNARTVRNLQKPSYGFGWIGPEPGRWRVQAMDASGMAGPWSDWTEFAPPP